MAPPGVSVHFGRLVSSGAVGSPIGLDERRRSMVELIDQPVDLLKLVKPDAMVLAYTAASYDLGRAGEAALTRRLEDKLGIPFTTAFASVVKALKHLGISRIALGAPYQESVLLTCKQELESYGFQVVRHGRIENCNNIYDDTDEQSAYRLARSVDSDDAEAIFLAGVGMPTVGVLQALETDTGKPAISSVSASMWNVLQLAKLPPVSPGYGSLLMGGQ